MHIIKGILINNNLFKSESLFENCLIRMRIKHQFEFSGQVTNFQTFSFRFCQLAKITKHQKLPRMTKTHSDTEIKFYEIIPFQ